MNPLYDAVSWIMVAFHTLLSPLFGEDSGWSWGLSIVGLVVVIRVLLIPLFVKQIKAQRGLQVLQPEIKKIQERYKNDREKQSQELMKLYRETGTNPLASCLPILAQAPIFFALFHVLDGIADGKARGVLTDEQVESAGQATIFGAPIDATFLGTDDLTVKTVTVVMIVLMSLAQFTTQRQLMVKNVPASSANNPFMQQQKMLLYVFPLIFAVFGINFPVGVLLYWLTTNLWSMGQQFFVIRRMPAPGSKAAEAREARLRAKGKVGGGTEGAAPAEGSAGAVAPTEQRPTRQQPVRQPRSKRRKKR